MKSSGVLKCNPVSKSGLPVGEWWLILECCPDLGRYYLEWLRKWYKAQFQLQKPAWDAHISVVRGEEPFNKAFWNSLTNKEISFSYFPEEMETNEEYWWIPVECEEVYDIRGCLGLSSTPIIPLHLSIARKV